MKTAAAPRITFYRHKVLLALLQAFGGRLSNIDLQKYLFLFTEQCQRDKSYEFVPYRYGCFSFQSYADRSKLAELGAISADLERWELAPRANYLAMLTDSDREKMKRFQDKYAGLSGDALVREMYARYPYYAIRSEIAGRLMSKAQLAAIEAERPKQKRACFFTIGYEGKSFEYYLNQLIRNNVRVLCDVRKNPLSRKYGFSKRVLSATLESLDILYIHMPELGIVSEKRQSLATVTDYQRLFDDYEATTLRDSGEALQRLAEVVKQHKRVAITCFEAEECMCHRGRVAKALQQLPDWKYPIKHL
ncbi:DUF488 family protein [Microbulbifer rhizosphaerae]|uniref:Uncharacterized protein (DUF488 family) n=1 Tax=Microbulbifer rhizosphaerae TaxID=1562603 RepID=A0A7W4WAJ4_9GAMM|nr:DUF488 domain-containing protein [Microbulbifer rhizosphaerae]MBB3060504.1 uncharacterized protein (DUF488 family) [Microbulbifer rhizosphaerae]